MQCLLSALLNIVRNLTRQFTSNFIQIKFSVSDELDFMFYVSSSVEKKNMQIYTLLWIGELFVYLQTWNRAPSNYVF